MNRVYVGGMFDLSMFGPDISTWSPRFAHYTAHVDHASIGFCQDAALPVKILLKEVFDKAWQEDGLSDDLRQ
ncbi:hypothetical protein X797_011634 [Metarhizium robertsii]|uniref:Uncharacterized protein n=1 Tax=Metarhizium robertsii TaxID=568076 RepID=A0A014P1Z2_9HYPO|nr:hypothetical protein X797_011634 [Metarhizium robertsii]